MFLILISWGAGILQGQRSGVTKLAIMSDIMSRPIERPHRPSKYLFSNFIFCFWDHSILQFTSTTVSLCYQWVVTILAFLNGLKCFFCCDSEQVMKKLNLKVLRMRGRRSSSLSRKRQSVPLPNLGVLSQERAEEAAKSCLWWLTMSTMLRNCRQLTHYAKPLSWKSYYLQNMMIFTWCLGVFIYLIFSLYFTTLMIWRHWHLFIKLCL